MIPLGPGTDDDEHFFKSCLTSLGQIGDISNSNVESGNCQTLEIQSGRQLYEVGMTSQTQSIVSMFVLKNQEWFSQVDDKLPEQTSMGFYKKTSLV